MGKELEVDNPTTFNEKLQWLKLYDRNPIYTTMVDKYEVKEYVANIIGKEHIIPTLGVWNHFDEIDFSKLPEQFVLKCTHDSGGLVIVKDKAKLNKKEAKRKIEKCLRRNYYYSGREWPYKNVKPRIIAEKYMEFQESEYLVDYKIFCFDGEPKIIMTVNGGHGDESQIIRRMYDADWNRYEVGLHGKEYEVSCEKKPKQLEEMLSLANQLSKGIKHLRVDFYIVEEQIYFGELTFYHMSGYEIFKPEKYDEIFGGFIKL